MILSFARCLAIHNDDQANILINQSFRACLADFGLSTIASIDYHGAANASLTSMASTASLMSFTPGGTTRWMSPELLDPDRFGITDSRPTKQSDCYALGMVIYEVRASAIILYKWSDLYTIRSFPGMFLIGRSQTKAG